MSSSTCKNYYFALISGDSEPKEDTLKCFHKHVQELDKMFYYLPVELHVKDHCYPSHFPKFCFDMWK